MEQSLSLKTDKPLDGKYLPTFWYQPKTIIFSLNIPK
jgi:hypothetical protein